jgi:hypothetical protein
MNMKLFSTLAVTGAVAFAGCGGDDEQQQAATPERTPAAAEATPEAPQSEVAFAAPTDGQTVSGPVKVSVDVSGFEIDPENVGKQPEAGTGHLHFTMDGGKFDKPKYSGPNGELAVKLGVDGKYSPAVAPEITYRKLPPGEHTLEVHLANNDHSDTGTQAETTFTVE